MTKELTNAQLNVIFDSISSSFDFRTLYNHISSEPPDNAEHHYWHFGGLRSYSITFCSTDDEAAIARQVDKLKLIQTYQSLLPPFWISYRKALSTTILTDLQSSEVIKKNTKLGKCFVNKHFRIAYSAGALIQLNKYIYDTETEILDTQCLVFYHDRIELNYGTKDNKLRKTFKADMMDRCAIFMTQETSMTVYINTTGNPIDYESRNRQLESSPTASIESGNYTRTAPRQSQPFYSTICLVISITNEPDSSEAKQSLNTCRTQLMEFFQRNHIHDCIGIIQNLPSRENLIEAKENYAKANSNSFIKQYCWQMLFSIGYRFQQRLNKGFIRQMSRIENDDEFYQVIAQEKYVSMYVTICKVM
jgi:hypothetical protein